MARAKQSNGKQPATRDGSGTGSTGASSVFMGTPSRVGRAALTGALTLCYTEIGGRRVAAEVAPDAVSDVTLGAKSASKELAGFCIGADAALSDVAMRDDDSSFRELPPPARGVDRGFEPVLYWNWRQTCRRGSRARHGFGRYLGGEISI